ncbi:hypothetical protein V9L05_03445 [Bernardetia sp. Wsw4-3y2]|uniref:hypothetical protein n=1 Tax=unclassified Bernardetia TaxID=2647129 RepID=UPI0030D200D1
MKSLKKKFGKFAISQEKANKVNGGEPPYPCKNKYFPNPNDPFECDPLRGN